MTNKPVHVSKHGRNIGVNMPKAPPQAEWEDFQVPPTEGRYGQKLAFKGYTAIIEQDPDPMSPREWDNVGHMATFHRNYILGDKDVSERFRNDPQGAEEELRKAGAEILDVNLYDHSGISLSTSSFIGRAQHAEWDSGKVGFIYATKEDIKKEYGKVTSATRAKARQRLKEEVETMDQFVKGDVYMISITDPTGESVDNVGGFYGIDYAKTEAADMLKAAATTTPKGQTKLA